MGAIRTWWRRVRAGGGARDTGADGSAPTADAAQALAAPPVAPAGPIRSDGPASFDQLLRQAAGRRPPAGQESRSSPSA